MRNLLIVTLLVGLLTMFLLDSIMMISIISLQKEQIKLDDQQVCISVKEVIMDNDLIIDSKS